MLGLLMHLASLIHLGKGCGLRWQCRAGSSHQDSTLVIPRPPSDMQSRDLPVPPHRVGHQRTLPEAGERFDVGQDLDERLAANLGRRGPRVEKLRARQHTQAERHAVQRRLAIGGG
jgi:hypothetical protein